MVAALIGLVTLAVAHAAALSPGAPMAPAGAPGRAAVDPVAPANDDVAVVFWLAGDAWTVAAAGRRVPLHLFAWLAAGTRVVAAPGARVALAFADGGRWELDGEAAATVAAAGPTAVAGAVRALPKVPPLPQLPPIDPRARPGGRAAAVRIRGDAPVRVLAPRDGEAILAEPVLLRFAPVPDLTRYRVAVEDEEGHVLLETEIEAATETAGVQVPAGALRPGGSYVWKVRGPRTPALLASARFQTLPAAAAAGRAALAASLSAETTPQALTLLAAADLALGLREAARERLAAAREAAPDNAAIEAALAAIEAALAAPRKTP